MCFSYTKPTEEDKLLCMITECVCSSLSNRVQGLVERFHILNVWMLFPVALTNKNAAPPKVVEYLN